MVIVSGGAQEIRKVFVAHFFIFRESARAFSAKERSVCRDSEYAGITEDFSVSELFRASKAPRGEYDIEKGIDDRVARFHYCSARRIVLFLR